MISITADRLTSLDVLRSCCEEVGECWHWLGHFSREGTPVLHGSGSTVTVRRFVYTKLNGKQIPKGARAGCSCKNRQCVNPAHITAETYSNQIRQAREDHPGIFRAANTKSAMTLRARSPIGMTEEKAQAIRESVGQGTQEERAARFGVTKQLVGQIDVNKAWRPMAATPFSGLGARTK